MGQARSRTSSAYLLTASLSLHYNLTLSERTKLLAGAEYLNEDIET